MSEKLQRFTKLLKEMFELDKSDFDFGIYHIMNIRKNEINNFIENTLAGFESRNVLFLEDEECIEKMLGKVL
ncbi:MAG: hypothetical protein HPY74_18195 [Firmicutes bacterium]|nr:hypothetical protein [Bacillota bacterium]